MPAWLAAYWNGPMRINTFYRVLSTWLITFCWCTTSNLTLRLQNHCQQDVWRNNVKTKKFSLGNMDKGCKTSVHKRHILMGLGKLTLMAMASPSGKSKITVTWVIKWGIFQVYFLNKYCANKSSTCSVRTY